jgi:urease accessory protein
LKDATVRIGIGALLLPALAAAHPIEGVGDFYSGMLHPLLALEQIVPMIALSLLAGQQERRIAVRILGIFPAALIIGSCVAQAFHLPPFYASVNTAAMVVLGLLVVLSRRMPQMPLLALTAVLGFCQGLPVGAEINGDLAPWRFIPGAGLTALIVIAYGVGLVRWLKAPWAQVAVRVAGSWVAAIGIMVLALK